jgi:hypothetical protein
MRRLKRLLLVLYLLHPCSRVLLPAGEGTLNLNCGETNRFAGETSIFRQGR